MARWKGLGDDARARLLQRASGELGLAQDVEPERRVPEKPSVRRVGPSGSAAALPSRICALVAWSALCLLFRNVAICCPVAEPSPPPRHQIAEGEVACPGRKAGERLSRPHPALVSTASPWLNFSSGNRQGLAGRPPRNRRSDPEIRDPYVLEPLLAAGSPRSHRNVNSRSRVPKPSSKICSSCCEAAPDRRRCPSRKAATENSIGIVATSVGVAPTSKAFLPFLKTCSRRPCEQMRDRGSRCGAS